MTDGNSSTIYLLHQAGQALRSRMEAEFRGLNITGLQFTILGLLDRYSGLSSAELARRFFVTPQTMNQIVSTMLKRGLLERTASEDNRRILEMRLSTEGRALLTQCTAIAAAVEADALAWMDDAELGAFRRNLAHLMRNLRAVENEPAVIDLLKGDETPGLHDGTGQPGAPAAGLDGVGAAGSGRRAG